MSESTEVRETVLEATGSRARLARVYAEALLAAAEKSGQAEAIGDELQMVAEEVFTQSKVAEYFDSAARQGVQQEEETLDEDQAGLIEDWIKDIVLERKRQASA